MGPLQQVPLVAWCLLVSLPLLGIFVRHRRTNSGPSRVKGLVHCTSEPSGLKAPVHEVNDSLDQPDQQSGIPKMQVLFFHGIPSEDFQRVHLTTWYHRDGFIWPQAWLPEEFPDIHVFFVKYNAGLENENFNMNNIGENLISDLLQAKIGQVPGCPVVLVGHCIGGLVIKELCWKAHEELHSIETSTTDRAKMLSTFLDNIKGIFYYSTPHLGVREIAKVSHVLRSPLFKFFETLNTQTAVLNSNFDKLRRRYSKWKIEGVGETLPVKLGVFQNTLVVEEASARVGIENFSTLMEDHFSICKPKEKTSGGFYHLTGLLHNIAKEEISLQEDRFKEEMRLLEESRPQNMQHLPKYLVGMENVLQDIKSRLESAATLGLIGMGGLGKTTIAKTLFNELGQNFEYTCFVHDVKLISGSVETLKKEVWKRMHRKGKKVGEEEDWSQLREKHILLVLDNVSKERDIQPLLEIVEESSKQSRFIATSREKDVFNLFDYLYEVPFLDESSAQQLFTSYAFPDKEVPPPKLASFVTEIVKKSEKLPLTLEVLGLWLKRRRNEEDWKQTLVALDKEEHVKNFNERSWTKLRPSIDGLEENEKQMFLDATTFFYSDSWTLREAQAAWREAYGVSERLLWQTLVDRSLVYDVKEDESIKVHEQLRSLGRKIANESNDYSQSRVLEITAAFRLLQSTNELDKKDIHALRVVRDQSDREENHALQSIAHDDNSEQIIFVHGNFVITSLALKQMKKLRYLDVDHDIEIDGAAEADWFPSSLVILKCGVFNALNLAHQKHLVVLKISGAEVETLPNSIGHLSALRIFVLSSIVLKSIPEEIGDLSKLEVLEILRCDSLETLPETLRKLSKLKILKLTACQSLHTLPNSIGKLSTLEHLELFACGFETLPESFGELSSLNCLRVELCKNFQSLPESFGLLPALVDLKFRYCLSLKSLPISFGHLSVLSRLEFVECDRLQRLPESLGKLSVLRHLKVKSCYVLRPLPESLGQLAKLEYLEITDVPKLERLPDLTELVTLRHLAISGLLLLKRIPDYIQNLPSLHTLELGVLPRVKELPPWLGKTGVNHLGLSRKVFRKQDRHFSLTRDETRTKLSYVVNKIHSRAMDKVRTSDYEGALAELEVSSLGVPKLDGFLFQEKGIIKRMMGDLHGALEYLTAAVELFSKVDDGHHYSYYSWKHRGYVNFLMGGMEAAENDRAMALKLQLVYRGSVFSAHTAGIYDFLGEEFTQYMHFRLEGRQEMKQNEQLLLSSHSEVLQKVKASNFQGALASFDVINDRVLPLDSRAFFLQERGILRRLAGNYGGALEDLNAALEILGDNYECLKHRGYVKYLRGDLDGARLDGKRCLTVGYNLPREEHLAATSVAFLEFNLK